MNKIYVKLDGRLGNQFFQYAFARKIQSLIGGELILDFTSLKLNASKGYYGENGVVNHLENFNVKPYRYIDNGNFDKNLIPRIQYLIFKFIRKAKPMTRRRWYVEMMEFLDHRVLQWCGIYFLESANPYKYLRWPKKRKNIFIRGWYEGSCYFKEIASELRNELTPKYPLPPQYEELFREISNNEYICVTIRRGDFVSSTFSNRYLICTPQYYKEAVKRILNRIPDARVFVCSDDIEWCKKNLDLGAEAIYEPDGLPIWEKVRFMSKCKHFVLSNSTFSWWCQFLSDYKNKIVVAPSVWRNEKPKPHEIFEPDWILLD